MAIYIDRRDVPDVENIPAQALAYIINKHAMQLQRYQKLHDYYVAKNTVNIDSDNAVNVIASYPRYIVDVIMGYYLGDPVKYDTKEQDQEENVTPDSFEAVVRNGRVLRHQWHAPELDIQPVLEAYSNQSISECDSKIGNFLGIYGEAYELEYASDDESPVPKTTVCDPRTAIMVRDTTVDHKKMFFINYEKREPVSGLPFYYAYVYTDRTVKEYATTGLETGNFRLIPNSERPHFFGEVPAVEYQNNFSRMGDFEQVTSLIDAYNELMSDRCTDKAQFIDAILAIYGAAIDDGSKQDLVKYKMLDNLPIDARIEYVQKNFDENSVHVLAQDLVTEIHKQTLTVDMTDESFAGNASGQALKLKLMTMNMLVKNKIRNFEKGLRKRFEMYNHWLMVRQLMDYVPKSAVDPVFTISMPINEIEIVNIVKQLEGIVDQQTLLGLLWFVRDPETVMRRVAEEKEQAQRAYLDTFGITAERRENIGTDDYPVRTREDDAE